MRIIWYVFAFLLLGACSLPQTPESVRPDQLQFEPLVFDFPQLQRARLSNGIEIYLKEDRDLPLIELTALIGGGSIFDPVDKTGLSQLFAESLATGGAGDLSPREFEKKLANMAVDMNVASDTYAYTLELSLHRRDLQETFQLLALLLREPRFDAERVDLACKRLVEGVRRQNDRPDVLATRLMAKAVYQDHPLGRSPSQSSLEHIRRDDLLALHRTYFQPQNLSIAVSGAIDLQELTQLLEQLLGSWPQGEMPDLTPPQLTENSQNGGVYVADKDIPQTTIMLGQPGIEKDNPDAMALRVANYILGGGGFNSRMMREIRSNRGLAYSVYSYFKIGYRLPELFVASCETACSSTLEVVSLMRAQMQDLIDRPVSEDELRVAKESLINSFVFAFNDSHSVVTRQQRLDFYAYPADYLQTYREKISAVTVDDVQRVAAEYLHPDKLQIVLVGRGKEFEEAVPATLGLPIQRADLGIE